MFDCKSVSTLMEAGKKFERLTNGEKAANLKEYQAAIGSLMYAAFATRQDISFAVGLLSPFMSNPGLEHIQRWK